MPLTSLRQSGSAGDEARFADFGARWRARIADFARRSPSRMAILVFTGLIALVTALLATPWAASDGQATPLIDALFTAVSTVCVTGLSTVDMATHWSPFGTVVILVGLQLGGIGVLTLASLLGVIVSRRLGLQQRLMAATEADSYRLHGGMPVAAAAVRLGEVGGLLATVVVSTLLIELALMLSFVPRLLAAGDDLATALADGFFFAATSFTNTGFVPKAEGMAAYATDAWMLGTIAAGVFLGGIGFPVIFALFRFARGRIRLPLHAKLTLVTTLALVVVGAVAMIVLEWSNAATLGAQEPAERVLTGGFLSVMTRSGGFATVDVGELNGATLLVLDMLMFVGGGSASTAGGIKVTTLAVLFLAAWAEARGDTDMQAFGRRIPHDVLRLAVSVVLWGATVIAVASILLLVITDAPLERVLFDTISAFATCGLSTGLTESLPDEGKLVLAATMWAGRVGTVTLAAALAASQRRQLFTRPEERPIVG